VGKNEPAIGLLGGGDRKGRLMGQLRDERYGEGKGNVNGDWIDDKIESLVTNSDSIDDKERQFLV